MRRRRIVDDRGNICMSKSSLSVPVPFQHFQRRERKTTYDRIKHQTPRMQERSHIARLRFSVPIPNLEQIRRRVRERAPYRSAQNYKFPSAFPLKLEGRREEEGRTVKSQIKPENIPELDDLMQYHAFLPCYDLFGLSSREHERLSIMWVV